MYFYKVSSTDAILRRFVCTFIMFIVTNKELYSTDATKEVNMYFYVFAFNKEIYYTDGILKKFVCIFMFLLINKEIYSADAFLGKFVCS